MILISERAHPLELSAPVLRGHVANRSSQRLGVSGAAVLFAIGLALVSLLLDSGLAVLLLGAALLLVASIRQTRHGSLGILSPFPAFAIGAAAYLLPLPITILAGGLVADSRGITLTSQLVFRAVWLHFLALLCAYLAYRVKTIRAAVPTDAVARWETMPVSLIGFAFVTAGAISLLALIMAVGGLNAFRAISYGERYELVRGLGFLAVGARLVAVGGVMLFAVAEHRSSSRTRLLTILAILLFFAVWVAITQRRRPLIEAAVMLAVIHRGSGRQIPRRVWLIGAASLFVFATWMGIARGTQESVMSVLSSNTAFANPANGETAASLLNTVDILSQVPSKVGYQLGATYLEVPLVFVPLRVWPERPLGAAEWYVKTFYADVWASGGGFAFSPVAEAYLNFGLVGVPVVFCIVGWMLGWLELRLARSVRGRPTLLMAYALLTPSLLIFFRLDAASLFKDATLFLLFPLAAATAVAALMRRAVRR